MGFFSYGRAAQWAVCLLALWFLLNIFDIVTTYQALSTGRAVERNPLMALLVGAPLLLVTVKMSLAFAAAKIVEKIEARSSSYALLSLVALNIYVALACVNNLGVYLAH